MAGLIGSPGGGGFFGGLEEIAQSNPNQWSSLAGNFLAGGSMRQSLAGYGKTLPVVSALDRQRRSAAGLLSSPLFATLSPEMQAYYKENPEAFAALLEARSKPKDLIKFGQDEQIYDPNTDTFINAPGGTGAAVRGPYKNTTPEGVDLNIIWAANQPGGDISTAEYAMAFNRQFEQELYHHQVTKNGETYDESVYPTLPAWVQHPTYSGAVSTAPPPGERVTEADVAGEPTATPAGTAPAVAAPAAAVPAGAGTPTTAVPAAEGPAAEDGAPAATTPVKLKTPPIGTVVNGYRFSGGNAGGTSGGANWQAPGTWEANFPGDAKRWAAAREAGQEMSSPGQVVAAPAAPAGVVTADAGGIRTEPGGARVGPRVSVGTVKPSEGQVRGQVLLQQAEPAYKTAFDNFGALEDTMGQAGSTIQQMTKGSPLAPLTDAAVRAWGQSPEYQRAKGAIRTLVTQYVFAVSGSTTRQAEVETITESLLPSLGEAASETDDKKARLTQTINAIRIRAANGLVAGQATDIAGATPIPVAAEE